MITQKELKQNLFYDRSTGEFFRLNTFNLSSTDNITPSGCFGGGGYIYIVIAGVKYEAHKLAILHEYGFIPAGVIDHIDGNRVNNKRSNLRAVSHKINMKNKAISVRNTSGFNGVQMTKGGRWSVFVGVDGNHKYIGTYKDIESATLARENANKKYGYHKNHGNKSYFNIKEMKAIHRNRKMHCYFGGYEKLDYLMMIRNIRGYSNEGVSMRGVQ